MAMAMGRTTGTGRTTVAESTKKRLGIMVAGSTKIGLRITLEI